MIWIKNARNLFVTNFLKSVCTQTLLCLRSIEQLKQQLLYLFMGKASRKKRRQESQAESILNGKSLISSDISSKWSLFNKPIVHFFLIAIVGFLVYSNTFNVPFQFDDIDNIIENYKLRDLNNFWTPSGSRWLGFLTFALNYHFGGLNTIGYHIVNLIIHIINAILVYCLNLCSASHPDTSSNIYRPEIYIPCNYVLSAFIGRLYQSKAWG